MRSATLAPCNSSPSATSTNAPRTTPYRSGVHERPQQREGAYEARSAVLPLATLEDLAAEAEHYVQNAHAARTRKAYQTDWSAFESWCATHQAHALPASPTTLELYLTHLAKLGRKASTIRRARMASRNSDWRSWSVRTLLARWLPEVPTVSQTALCSILPVKTSLWTANHLRAQALRPI